MFIKSSSSKLDLTSTIGGITEMSVHHTIESLAKELLSKSPKSSVRSVFSKQGTQFLGELMLENGWASSIKGQEKQLDIQILSRRPVPPAPMGRNHLPQWGRMAPSKTPTPWSKPASVKSTKSSDIRNSHFDAALLVAKSEPYIQDTFSKVFESNTQHLLGRNRGL